MERGRSFPLRVEKHGVTVPVYRVRSGNGYTSFVVSYRENGTRKRLSFGAVDDAIRAAKVAAGKIASGNVPCVGLTQSDGVAYRNAVEALRPFQISVDLAAKEYAEGLHLLAGRASILEAVRHFARTCPVVTVERTVTDVVEELITTRERDGSNPRHVADLASRLRRFAASMSCPIANVTPARIQDFLLSLGLAPRTANNFRTSISNLLSFAKLRRYVAPDSDPLGEVPEMKEPDREVGIYTPAELQRMIGFVSPGFLPYLVTGAFAGLRQSELERLDWADIGEKYIRVRVGERRTKSTRIVEIQPNLRAWLETLRKSSGPLVPFANVGNQLTRLAKKSGVSQSHNGLRHSYGSYRLALLQDAAKVSFEMGNSPKMVFEHYREIVTPEQAARWFGITPPIGEAIPVGGLPEVLSVHGSRVAQGTR